MLNLSNDSYRKPSPLFGKKILEDYKIDKSNLIYIGDNMTDLETAHNIGCNAYGIINDRLSPNVSMNTFGFKTFKDLKKLINTTTYFFASTIFSIIQMKKDQAKSWYINYCVRNIKIIKSFMQHQQRKNSPAQI